MRSNPGGNWTPGPWKVEEPFVSIGCWDIKNNEGNEVTKIWAKGSNHAKANAHLIAAAPEMYEALKDVLSYLPARDGKRVPGDPDGDVQLMIANKIKQAFAKAEGRQEW